MIRRPPRSTRTDTLFPYRRSSDLKTAAFVLPLLQRLFVNKANTGSRKPRALILAPTRELAVQVHDSLRAYAKHLRVNSTAIYGGNAMRPQFDALRRGVDVLVATPGRLIDHMDRRTADLSGRSEEHTSELQSLMR